MLLQLKTSSSTIRNLICFNTENGKCYCNYNEVTYHRGYYNVSIPRTVSAIATPEFNFSTCSFNEGFNTENGKCYCNVQLCRMKKCTLFSFNTENGKCYCNILEVIHLINLSIRFNTENGKCYCNL